MMKKIKYAILVAVSAWMMFHPEQGFSQSKLDGTWKVDLKETSTVVGCFGHIWEKLKIKDGEIVSRGLNFSGGNSGSYVYILANEKPIIGKPFKFKTVGRKQGTAVAVFQENIAKGSWTPDRGGCTLDFTFTKE